MIAISDLIAAESRRFPSISPIRAPLVFLGRRCCRSLSNSSCRGFHQGREKRWVEVTLFDPSVQIGNRCFKISSPARFRMHLFRLAIEASCRPHLSKDMRIDDLLSNLADPWRRTEQTFPRPPEEMIRRLSACARGALP